MFEPRGDADTQIPVQFPKLGWSRGHDSPLCVISPRALGAPPFADSGTLLPWEQENFRIVSSRPQKEKKILTKVPQENVTRGLIMLREVGLAWAVGGQCLSPQFIVCVLISFLFFDLLPINPSVQPPHSFALTVMF